MPEIFLLESDYSTIGVLNESYSSFEIIEKYQGVDSFRMTMASAALYASDIQNGRMLYLPREDDALFLIEQIQEDVDESKDEKAIAGRSVDGFALSERRVDATGIDYDSQLGVAAETAMKHYVNAHAGPGAPIARRIPGLVIATDLVRGGSIDYTARFQTLLQVLSDIGRVSGLGWRAPFDPVSGQVVFDAIEGADRTASVFFDFAFETLRSWTKLDSIADSKTFAIVAGQGELAARDIVKRYVGTEPTGFARREDFVDARDVELGNTAVLEVRGDAFLATRGPERSLEATINEQGSFQFGIHWFNGDIVTIRNEAKGLEYAARVLEVHRKWIQSNLYPETTSVLDRPIPKWKDQIEKVAGGVIPIVDLRSGGAGGDCNIVVAADILVVYGGGVGWVVA